MPRWFTTRHARGGARGELKRRERRRRRDYFWDWGQAFWIGLPFTIIWYAITTFIIIERLHHQPDFRFGFSRSACQETSCQPAEGPSLIHRLDWITVITLTIDYRRHAVLSMITMMNIIINGSDPLTPPSRYRFRCPRHHNHDFMPPLHSTFTPHTTRYTTPEHCHHHHFINNFWMKPYVFIFVFIFIYLFTIFTIFHASSITKNAYEWIFHLPLSIRHTSRRCHRRFTMHAISLIHHHHGE